jgi:O-antigen/teichoic acid export membrane protein
VANAFLCTPYGHLATLRGHVHVPPDVHRGAPADSAAGFCFVAPMSPGFGRRALPLFSAAIMDQVVLSGTNFLVGMLLIRYASANDYALYVLVQSALMLLITVHNSWLTGPLAILTPKLSPDERWQTIGSVKQIERRFLRLVALPLLMIPLLSYLTGQVTGVLAAVIASGIAASWAGLRREYLRSVLFMYSRPQTLLGADLVYAAALLLGVILGLLFARPVVVGATCALVVAGWAGAAAAHRSLAIEPGWHDEGSVSIWPGIRSLGFWSLLGASTYWFLGQSYSYILAARLGLIAVADANATRLVLMPAMILTIGVASLLTPSAATWYVQIGIHRLVRRLLMFVLAIGLLEVTYFVCVWIFRNWLFVEVLHKHIHERDRLLLLWAGVGIVALFRDVLQCALIAMGRLKSLAWQVGISTAVALPLMWFGTAWWGSSAALIGQIAGELINLAGIILLLRRCVRESAAV